MGRLRKIGVCFALLCIFSAVAIVPRVLGQQIYVPITSGPGSEKDSLQLQPIPFVTVTPSPTPKNTSPNSPQEQTPDTKIPGIPMQPPPDSVQTPPGNHTKRYCVDDNPGVKIEPCDDASKCDLPHGAGGPSSTCGSVIGWEHALIDAVGQGSSKKSSSGGLSTTVTSKCYTAQATGDYVSTYNVIDAYNLAGFKGTTRSAHANGKTLQSWWQSSEAKAAGYRYVSGSSMQGVGPGYVMFFSSGHVAIVNHVQTDSRGNGRMSFLHSGGGFYLGLGIVVNGNLQQTSANESVVGFGGHQTGAPFSTEGTPACTGGKGKD